MNSRKLIPEGPLPRKMIDAHFRDLALRAALHCVRNTILEEYHAAGKLTDPEMAAFNREVANKLYAFLTILFHPDYTALREGAFEWLYLPEWDEPIFDRSFVHLVERIRRGARPATIRRASVVNDRTERAP